MSPEREDASEQIPFYALYGQIDSAVAVRFMHVESIESRNAVYQWNIRPHRHYDLYQLVWVERGHGEVLLDGRVLNLKSPVLIGIPPILVHGFRWVPGADGLVVTISERFVSDLLEVSEDAAVRQVIQQPLVFTQFAPQTHARVRQLLAGLMEEYVHDRASRTTVLAGQVILLLAQVARLHPNGTLPSRLPPRRGRLLATCQRFRTLVEAHFRERWPIARYAQELAMTQRSLHRLCLQGLGLSPQQVVHRRLLMEARRELLYTQRGVAEIAYSLGFDDPSYFSHFFTRLEGESPALFRRKRHNPDWLVQ